MAEDDKIVVSTDESDIDQINRLVVGSESQKYTISEDDEGPTVVMEEKKAVREEQSHSADADSGEDKEHHPIKHSNSEDNKERVESKKDSEKQSSKKHEVKNNKSKSLAQAVHAVPKKVPENKKIESGNGHADKTIVHKKTFLKKVKPVEKPKHKTKIIKKIEKSEKKNGKSSRNSILLWIGIGLLAVILIVALILLIIPDKKPVTDSTTVNTVAATVNGEAIYIKDVMTQYNNLNPALQQVYTVETILNKSVDDLLLYQKARDEGISIKDNVIQKEINVLMEQNGVDETQFIEALSQQGMTLDDAKNIIRKNMAIRQLLNDTILHNIIVNADAIKNYYEMNSVEFKVPEQVTIQHILVMPGGDFTLEDAKEKIESIYDELTDSNFCELALKYSEDPGSKDRCGEYTFARGDFNNPQFENPSFDLSIGESSIIETTFGYHIIKKIESIPEGTMSLEEAYTYINDTLYNQIAQERFDEMLQELRDDAIIINYYTKSDSTESNNPNQTDTTTNNLDTFAKCLTDNGAKMYGAYWCSHCNAQKTMFGESVQYITYIECAVEGKPQVQTSECTTAGITGYPTWIINGKKYPGQQPLKTLADLTGCSLT
jgi:foldase protein PrsA